MSMDIGRCRNCTMFNNSIGDDKEYGYCMRTRDSLEGLWTKIEVDSNWFCADFTRVHKDLGVDTKLLVWDGGSDRKPIRKWKRHFAKWNADGRPLCYDGGATSWSAGKTLISWDNYEVVRDDEGE